jgi:hypothetical protein
MFNSVQQCGVGVSKDKIILFAMRLILSVTQSKDIILENEAESTPIKNITKINMWCIQALKKRKWELPLFETSKAGFTLVKPAQTSVPKTALD